VAKSKSGDFYTFDEVLKQLQIDENRLKRLVSEGEIRAFREGDQMRFKRTEIDSLAGRVGGRQTSDTSLTEISLEDDSQPTVNVGAGAGDTLSDELGDLGADRTAEISSQDTYIDQDVGMSTEPIDFTEDDGIEDVEEIEDIGVDRPSRRGPAARPQRRPVVVDEGKTGAGWVILLAFAAVIGVCGTLVMLSNSNGYKNNFTGWFAENFGPKAEAQE
jgi:excisionase family DNA binding protein